LTKASSASDFLIDKADIPSKFFIHWIRGQMNHLKAKTVAVSAVNGHTHKVFPNDLNSNGTAFGGMIVGILDRTALVVAERHSCSVCVTASIDAMHFIAPAIAGDILIFNAAINRSWRTSMEIGVKVIAEHYQTSEIRHILSAYFTFVAVDEHHKPIEVPEVIPETALEKRRYEEAEIRRQKRLLETKERHERRKNY
jgi:acyl-CoA hydrolase